METSIIIISLVLNLGILALLFFRKNEDRSKEFFEVIEKSGERSERLLREEISFLRKTLSESARETREEIAGSIKDFGDSVSKQVFQNTQGQTQGFQRFNNRLDEVVARNDERMERVRGVIEKNLENIRKDNSEKLEKMRETVDEKLHATLEKRLTESFGTVTKQLEVVHQGLGEMKTLATGVGDLKKVLQNVKTRGTWGEVQLGNLLDQMLTVEQYEKNVVTRKGSNDRVEFAIRIPSKDEKIGDIWLPIDAKFPLEDYQSLIEAEDRGDIESAEKLGKALEMRVKSEAKDIRDKYIDPPYTTDFGILFLPIEGLYAEVLRRPGFTDMLQREYKVIVTGPTTIAAILSSLQMGFRTLAIEKRSSEVWSVLGAVKKEFSTFGDILDKTQKKLQEASNSIEKASSKSRTIERKLGKVEEIPVEIAEEKSEALKLEI